MKARRPEDPRNYVLVEQFGLSANYDPHTRHQTTKVEKRVLADDENVYQLQHSWKNNAGRFVLVDRSKAYSEGKKRKEHIGPFGRIMKLANLGRDKKEKLSKRDSNEGKS